MGEKISIIRKTAEGGMGRTGQAMLEYALLTSIVVVAGLSFYMTGWFEGVQNYVYDVLLGVSLPLP